MGRDKAKLPVESRSLVEDVAAKVASVTKYVALVGAVERYRDLNIDCLPDLRPGLGPLAGVEAALAARRGELNLIVACDMPNLRAEWLRCLLAQARQPDVLCVTCKDAAGAVHPLCSVWNSRCLPAVSAALAGQRLRAMDLIRELCAECVEIHDRIWNINTPADWENWRVGTKPGA